MNDSDFSKTIQIDASKLKGLKKSTIDPERDKVRPDNKSKAYFVITAGPDAGNVIFINKPDIVIGREKTSDIVIRKGFVSRRHAIIKSIGKLVSIKDLGSTNGTFVNNERIELKVLKDGDEIQAGEMLMKFFQEKLEPDAISQVAASKEEPPSAYYNRVFKICEAYFGTNTRFFLNRQIRSHLNKTPQTISISDRPELTKWIKISAGLLLGDTRADELVDKVIKIVR